MPVISNEKKQRIQEQVLQFLFQSFPKQLFTADIAREIARDEEFIKVLLNDLFKKDLVVRIDKNPDGINYLKRARWRLSNKAHDIYAQQIKAKSQAKQMIISSEEQNSENSSQVSS